MMKRNTAYSDPLERNDRRERIIAMNRARRTRQLRNRMIAAAVFTFILVGVLSIAFGSILSQAKSNGETEEVKCFSSVMIGYGETVDSLVEEYYDEAHYTSYDSYKQEVMDINSIDENCNITPGNYIVLPYYTEL